MKIYSWSTKWTLLLVSSLTIMSIVTISPSLPEMNEVFSGINNADFLVKLSLTIPAFWIAVSAVISGILIDRFGRLRFLWTAMVIYAVAGTAGFWLEDLVSIIISRSVLGMAVGISMTVVVTLIADYFEGLERQKFIGLQVAFMSLGGIVFIGLGGVLADIGWRYPFLIYGLSLLILPLAILFLHEPDRVQLPDISETVSRSPSLIWLLFVNVLLMWVLFFLIPVQVPFHLDALGVESKSLIGVAIAASTAFSAVSAFLYSKLKERFTFQQIFSLGYCLMALGFLVLSGSSGYAEVLVSMMLCGLGMGMMIPNTNMWVMNIAPPEIRGREIGRLTTFWFMGQFLSPIVLLPLSGRLSLSALFMVATIVLALLAMFFFIFDRRAHSSAAG